MRRSFGEVGSTCPSCGESGHRNIGRIWKRRYCESACVVGRQDVADGGFVDATTYSSKRTPHVHHTCKMCGFQLTSEPHSPNEVLHRS